MTKNAIIFTLLFFVALTVYVAWAKSKLTSTPGEPVACTLDALICPDGTTVGRTGPKCEFAPCPSVAPTASATPAPDENITITSPRPNEVVIFPLTVTGQARTFESTLQVELLNEKGKVIFKKTTMANSPDVGQFGPYTVTIPPQVGKSFTVKAYENSAKDGSEINVVTVSVTTK